MMKEVAGAVDYQKELLENVHPPDWRPPAPADRYNLVVIGAGTAGLVTAAGAAGLGAKVALVERERMGGDCLNFGCVPSKALLRAARAAADARNAGAFGVRIGGDIHVDFPAVMQRMRRLRAEISNNDSAHRFQSLGVDVFLGQARFAGAEEVEVNGRRLRFAKAVLATGARPARPDIPGLDDVGYQTNETVFSLEALPQRLAVLGAGPIGCELAQAFARFGAKVTLVENHARILPREDADAAGVVEEAMARDGVRLLACARLLGARRDHDGKRLMLQQGDREWEETFDEILVGVGRTPNVEGLDLERVNVQYDARSGVVVDDRLRTTNPRIYAAGDVCSRFKFTHAADAMARIVIQNSLFLGRARASDLLIPWCTYTDPEVAHVGVSEASAAKDGIPIRTFRMSLAEVDRAILDGDRDGLVKVHVGPKSDQILGATIVARHGGEMIGELVLAMKAKVGLGAISKVIHPYPTQAEAIRRTGDAYQRTRLTPLLHGIVKGWLAWRR